MVLVEVLVYDEDDPNDLEVIHLMDEMSPVRDNMSLESE